MRIIVSLWDLFTCTLPIIGVIIAGRALVLGCQCEGPRKAITYVIARFDNNLIDSNYRQ
jgi:hypothetical protein